MIGVVEGLGILLGSAGLVSGIKTGARSEEINRSTDEILTELRQLRHGAGLEQMLRQLGELHVAVDTGNRQIIDAITAARMQRSLADLHRFPPPRSPADQVILLGSGSQDISTIELTSPVRDRLLSTFAESGTGLPAQLLDPRYAKGTLCEIGAREALAYERLAPGQLGHVKYRVSFEYHPKVDDPARQRSISPSRVYFDGAHLSHPAAVRASGASPGSSDWFGHACFLVPDGLPLGEYSLTLEFAGGGLWEVVNPLQIVADPAQPVLDTHCYWMNDYRLVSSWHGLTGDVSGAGTESILYTRIDGAVRSYELELHAGNDYRTTEPLPREHRSFEIAAQAWIRGRPSKMSQWHPVIPARYFLDECVLEADYEIVEDER